MSGGARFRGLAPGQHSSEKTSQQWRAADDTVFYFTNLEFEPKTFRTNSDVLITEQTAKESVQVTTHAILGFRHIFMLFVFSDHNVLISKAVMVAELGRRRIYASVDLD